MENVQNFRDLGDAAEGLQKGLIFRSANPAVASSKDVQFLRNGLGLKWVIDLRSPEEILEDGKNVELFQGAEKCDYIRNGFTGGPEFKVYKTTSKTPSQFPPLVVHHMTLLERNKYYMALLFKINPCTALQIIIFGIFVPEYGRQLAILEVNKGGLSMLYEIILDTANKEIGQVMNRVLDAIRHKQPLLFNCKAGKDRTGLIAMLVLSCAGATDEEIVEDYVKSDSEGGMVALGGIEKRKELKGLDYNVFSGAPMEAMEHALKYVRRRYGSVAAYLEKSNFDKQKQNELGQRFRGQL